MKTVTYFEMEYPELDELVEQHLGIEYESIAENEWNNSSSYTFNVKKEELDAWDTRKLDAFTNGQRDGNLWANIVLQELVNRNVLPAGEYLIEVSW